MEKAALLIHHPYNGFDYEIYHLLQKFIWLAAIEERLY
jgi:hypothetical protein